MYRFCIKKPNVALKRFLEGWIEKMGDWRQEVNSGDFKWPWEGPVRGWPGQGQRDGDEGEILGSGMLVERPGVARRWHLTCGCVSRSQSRALSWNPPKVLLKSTTVTSHTETFKAWDLDVGTPRAYTFTADNKTGVVWFLCRKPFQFWSPTWMFPQETRWKQRHLCWEPLRPFPAALCPEG